VGSDAGSAGGWPIADCTPGGPAGDPVSPDLIRGHNCTVSTAELTLSEVVGQVAWVDEWSADVYVTAGEATLWRSREGAALREVSDGFEPELTVDVEPVRRVAGHNVCDAEDVRANTGVRDGAGRAARVARGLPGDYERAGRRRRGRVRRLCRANDITYLSTLTYRGVGQFSWEAMSRDVRNFRRRVRARFPGLKGPLLTVPEWHPGGHGLHVHVGTADYVPKELLEACWPHGFVDNGERRRRRRGPISPLLAARYVSKYLSKEPVGSERPAWGHGYEITQGFQPRRYRVVGLGQGAVEVAVRSLVGMGELYVWDSATCEDWCGPPAGWVSAEEPSVGAHALTLDV
jgi:hypothetical protein